jgi:colicin import membrane protein
MLSVIRENPRAFAYAVLMHLVLLVLLIIGLDWTPKVSAPGSNQPIQTELVTHDPLKQIEQRKQEQERQHRAEQEKQRKAEEKAAAEAKQKAAARKKAEAEAKQKAALAARKKAEAEAQVKAAAEAKQKAAEAAKKAEAEAQEKAAAEAKQKAAEAAKKAEAEAKKKAAAEAQAKAAAEARKKAEAELQAQVAAEQEEQRAQDALSKYIPYIQDKVTRNWIRPPGSPEGLVCVVKVRLIPGGEVVGATVIRSSGDPVFDRSVETAVLKASPLPLPPDASLFDHFREINFNFNPGR